MNRIVRYISISLLLSTFFLVSEAIHGDSDVDKNSRNSLGFYSRVGADGEKEQVSSFNGAKVGLFRKVYREPRIYIPYIPNYISKQTRPPPPTTKPNPKYKTKKPGKRNADFIFGRNQAAPVAQAGPALSGAAGGLGGLLGGGGGGGGGLPLGLDGLLSTLLGGLGR